MIAIKMWTEVNDFDDLDELMGIVSVKDFSDEFEADEAPKPTTSTKIKIQSKSPKTGPVIPTQTSKSIPYLTPIMNSIFDPTYDESIPEGIKVFRLNGNIIERAYKYANLDVFIGPQNIFLHSLEFIYDLKTTDKEFDISVIEVDDNRRTTLYRDKVVFNSRSSGPFTSFEFMKKIELQAGKKIWFRIEYPRAEIRKTYHHYDAIQDNDLIFQNNDIILRRDYSYNSYSENICAIFYTLL
jgi:hypothetical protein